MPESRGRTSGIVHDKISSDFLHQKIKRVVKKDSHSEACIDRVAIATSCKNKLPKITVVLTAL